MIAEISSFIIEATVAGVLFGTQTVPANKTREQCDAQATWYSVSSKVFVREAQKNGVTIYLQGKPVYADDIRVVCKEKTKGLY